MQMKVDPAGRLTAATGCSGYSRTPPPGSDGDVIAAIFPRASAELQRSGLRLCSAELDEQHEAEDATRVLREHGFHTAALRAPI